MTKSHNAETPLSSTHHKPATSRSSLARTLVKTVLVLMIIGSIAYVFYTNRQLSNQIQTLTTDAVALKQQQIDTKSQLDSPEEKLDSRHTELNKQLALVSKNLSQALQERWYQNNDWLLLKARYYLELAAINLHWSDNTQITSALFQQADDVLSNLHESELFNVRQSIANEIAQLQAAPTIDIAGLLAKLDAAQQLTTHLPTKNLFTLAQTNPTEEATNKASSAWREQVQNSIKLLKKLVLIRHHDEAIKPLPAPGSETLLRETIFLNLQEAQWAVIQHNNEVYKLSLTQTINTVKRAFDQSSTDTQALLKQLQQLQETQLDANKPTAGESLLLLNQVIESQKNSKIIPEKNIKLPVAEVAS